MTNTVVHFDSFGIECITEEVLSKMKDISITRNICRIQSDDPIMCEYYCVAKLSWKRGKKRGNSVISKTKVKCYQNFVF